MCGRNKIDNYFLLKEGVNSEGDKTYTIAHNRGFPSIERAREHVRSVGLEGWTYIICGRTTHCQVKVRRELV